MKKHNIESRFVIGPENMQVYARTFEPENCTGFGSEGVNVIGHGGSGNQKRDWAQ